MFYFPRPYPDEVIGSLVTRACLHTGVHIKGLAWLIYGRQHSYSSFLLASSFRPLAILAGLDPEELLWDHTVFPYVVAFMPDAVVTRLQAMVMSPVEEHVGCIASCTQSVTQGAAYRRYCPACVRADEQTHGESYWHRVHQLPAVYVCPLHRGPLLETTYRIRGLMRKWQYALPGDTPGRPIATDLNPPLQHRLAQASQNLLRRDNRTNCDWATHYRSLAFAAGYSRTGDLVAGRRLAQDLASYYGTPLLKDTGCAYTVGYRNYWPALMVRQGVGGPFAPIKHLLLKNFLQCRKASDPQLGYGAPGPRRRDRAALDREFAKRARKAFTRLRRGRTCITVTELMTRAGCWATYRHAPQDFPKTQALLRVFRQSEWSARRARSM